MLRAIGLKIATGGILGLLTVMMLAVSLVRAQELGDLIPSFGDGKLQITGDGFQADESVTITVDVDGARQQLTVKADSQGRFRLPTDIPVKPGASVQLDARGDKGTTMAAITSVPLLPLAGGSVPPGQLPRSGSPALPVVAVVAVGLSLIGSGLALGRVRR